MSHSPFVTVVMPAHNVAPYIRPAIQSVLNQTYTDFELWVLENGSTDNTASIAKQFKDSRVKVFELGSVGFTGALQYALENSSSPWLARIDGDDLILPNRLAKQVEVALARPELVLIGTSFAFMMLNNRIFEQHVPVSSRPITIESVALSSYRQNRTRGRFFADASGMFRREVALEAGGYDHEFRMGDVPLWFRILKRGEGWEIRDILYIYRILPMSYGGKHNDYYKVREKYAPEFLPAYRPAGKPTQPNQRNCTYWSRICRTALIVSDYAMFHQGCQQLQTLGCLDLVKRFRWQGRLARLGLAPYYRRKYGKQYHHRPDLEEVLQPLINGSA